MIMTYLIDSQTKETGILRDVSQVNFLVNGKAQVKLQGGTAFALSSALICSLEA